MALSKGDSQKLKRDYPINSNIHVSLMGIQIKQNFIFNITSEDMFIWSLFLSTNVGYFKIKSYKQVKKLLAFYT